MRQTLFVLQASLDGPKAGQVALHLYPQVSDEHGSYLWVTVYARRSAKLLQHQGVTHGNEVRPLHVQHLRDDR